MSRPQMASSRTLKRKEVFIMFMSKSRLWPRMRPQRPAFNSLNIFENEVMLHGKFQPPNFNNVAVHTYVINRNTDIKGG